MRNAKYLLLTVTFLTFVSAACSQTGSGIVETRTSNVTPIRKVFVNATGDEALSHKVYRFLDVELEDSGVTLVTTEKDADLVLNLEIRFDTLDTQLIYGLTRVEYILQDKTETAQDCGSLSTGDGAEFFDKQAEWVAHDLQKRFPNAHAIQIDSGSKMQDSQVFERDFPVELKKSKLNIVNSNPDVSVRITLEKKSIPRKATIVSYEFRAVGRGEYPRWTGNGNVPYSSKLMAPAPQACPDRFTDLSWIAPKDAAYDIAHSVASHIRHYNAGGKVSPIGD